MALFIVPLILIIILVVSFFVIPIPYQEQLSFPGTDNPIITIDNFDTLLENHDLINALPDDSLIHLKIESNDYTLTKGNIETGIPDNPDMKIIVPESYISDIKNGLCKTIQNAKKNGDFKVEKNLSLFSLYWKYKSMFRFKSCLGIGIDF